jgi:hypothetical protein
VTIVARLCFADACITPVHSWLDREHGARDRQPADIGTSACRLCRHGAHTHLPRTGSPQADTSLSAVRSRRTSHGPGPYPAQPMPRNMRPARTHYPCRRSDRSGQADRRNCALASGQRLRAYPGRSSRAAFTQARRLDSAAAVGLSLDSSEDEPDGGPDNSVYIPVHCGERGC